MTSSFTSTSSPYNPGSFAAPTSPAIAGAATGTGKLTEKSLELTFCSQFAAEMAHHHHVPWPHRMVWFGLTQLQENELGFDAATSLGGWAVIFQFKASHRVTKKRGRQFKVEHDQMEILQTSFAAFRNTCFYVFPDVGNVVELAAINSNVVGNSWLLDVADLPTPIPPPYKKGSSVLRMDNCHYAHLGRPATGAIEFHSQPFKARSHKAKEFASQFIFPQNDLKTPDVIRLLKAMDKESPLVARRFFRNTVLGVFVPD